MVSGNGPAAAALSLRLPELIDGRYDRCPAAPGANSQLLQRCGAVQIGSPQTVIGGTLLGPEFPGQRLAHARPRRRCAPRHRTEAQAGHASA